MGFGLEQPASPRDYNPEVVTLWDTPQWHDLCLGYKWGESDPWEEPQPSLL